MIIDDLALLFERDLSKLKNEIAAYPVEGKLWGIVDGIKNSGGNLCLHLVGNLQNYIGNVLGSSGYVRNREEEFSSKNIPVSRLIEMIGVTQKIVVETIRSLNADALENKYPQDVLGYEMSTGYFLLHLLAHLNYHLGQINYHRRMIG